MPDTEQNIRSDEKLTELIRKGDPHAFKELYFKYYNSLYRYAYYRIYSVETTRDLIQELFSRVWHNRNSLDPNKSIKSYLYRSLTNIIINHSELKSSQNVSLSNVSEDSSSTQNDFDSEIDLRTAVDQLSEKLKSVYLMSRVEGYKYSEIAEILNISVKAVEKRMTKALKILREKFLK